MEGGELFAKISERTRPFTEQGMKHFLIAEKYHFLPILIIFSTKNC
jgi:hypothetical protein